MIKSIFKAFNKLTREGCSDSLSYFYLVCETLHLNNRVHYFNNNLQARVEKTFPTIKEGLI